MINTQDLIWQSLEQAHDVPDAIMYWLDDNQSLTAKLKRKFDDFAVDVLLQTQLEPHENETTLLGFKGDSIIREVALLGVSKLKAKIFG